MSHQLVALLQECSEVVCGTALPVEMCDYILNECGGKLKMGMRTTCAHVVRISICRHLPSPKSIIFGRHRYWRKVLRASWRAGVPRPSPGVPDWVKEEVLQVRLKNPIWPYASAWAVVCAIDRGQEVYWSHFAASRRFWATWSGPDPPKPWDPCREPRSPEEN